MSAPRVSKVFVGTISLFSFEKCHHPLHLAITKVDFDFLGDVTAGVNSETLRTVAISREKQALHEGGKGHQSVVFASLQVQPLALAPDSATGRETDCVRVYDPHTASRPIAAVKLHCTRAFIDRYGFHEQDQVYLKFVTLYPISKAVLEAQNTAVFSWAKKRLFSTGLLLLSCQGEVLIRQGDPFLAPCCKLFQNDPAFDIDFLSSLRVLNCEPTSQGILTINTEIVILTPAKMDADGKEDQGASRLMIKPAMVSSFALQPNIPHKNKRLGTLEHQWLCAQQKDRWWKAKTTVCHRDVIPQLFCSKKRNAETEVDVHGSLFISKQFALKTGLFQGSFVELKLSDCETAAKPEKTAVKLPDGKNGMSSLHEINGVVSTAPRTSSLDKCGHSHKKPKRLNKARLASVCILDSKDHDKSPTESCQTMILPTLFFNLAKSSKGCLLTKEADIQIQKFQSRTTDDCQRSCSCYSEIPWASEVHLSLVNSPDYGAASPVSTVLQQHFTVPRLLQAGDILCIDTQDDAEFHQDLSDGTEVRQPSVYFKVTKISPKSHGHRGTYLVDVNHSTVFQDGSVHSYAPTEMSRADSPEPPGLQEYIHKLQNILKPYLLSRNQCEELHPSVLLTGGSGCGKSSVCKTVAASLNMHYYQVNCHDLCGEASAATEARIKHVMQRAATYAPCLLVLRNIECLGKDRDSTTDDPRVSGSFLAQIQRLGEDCADWPVVVIATSCAVRQLTADMRDVFLHHIEMEVPSEEGRREMLGLLMRNTPCAPDFSLGHLAQRTAGMVLGDMNALICHAKRKAFQRAKSLTGRSEMTWEEEVDLCLAGFPVRQQDFEAALDTLQAAHSDAIGAPKIPNVTWDDVGGLASVKAEILDTIQLPLQHPELFAAGLRRSGVLLYGPPGTGKTLLAKAVATECSLNFLSVKGPELINMYVGQSEENVREVFSRARSATPCVIFFDELDSLAPNRGRSGDSGGVMDRVVSQLLAELDGLHKSCDVFVIGATNRPDLLDPALLRPGRFDKLLFLGVSEDRTAQLKIMKALTRKFNLQDSCSLKGVVEKCPFNMTGADFYALCSDAMLSALKRKIDQLEAGETVDQTQVNIGEDDFLRALDSLVPSVSEIELQRFKAIQQQLVSRK